MIYCYSIKLGVDHYGLGKGGWSPEGTKLLVANQILDANTLEVLIEMEGFPRGWLYNGSQVFGITTDEIYTRDAATGNLLQTIPINVQIEEAVASPDGIHVASAIGNTIHIFDLDNGSMTSYTLPRGTVIHSFVWSPNGTQIAFTAGQIVEHGTLGSVEMVDVAVLYSLQIMNISTGEIILISNPLPELTSLNWSDVDNRLAGISVSNNLYLWNAETLELISSFSLPQADTLVSSLDFDSNGEFLTLATVPRTTAVYQQTDRLELPLVESTQVVSECIQIIGITSLFDGE